MACCGYQPLASNAWSAPELLFLTRDESVTPGEARLHAIACEVGYRSVVVPWDQIGVGRGIAYARKGFEYIAPHSRRRLPCGTVLRPAVILHRLYMSPDREELFLALARTFPTARLSYDPEFKSLSSKWGAELCLRKGEARGLRVERPQTFLVRKEELATLADQGEARPLIYKPADGSRGEGIRLSTPASFDRVVRDLEQETGERFVVQHLVQDALRLAGRAFDLRLYVFVHGFGPPRFSICRDGIVRVASRDPSEAPAGRDIDPKSVITNCAFRSDGDEPVDNLAIPELLRELHGFGYDVRQFWDSLRELVGSLVSCFVRCSSLPKSARFERLFLVTGLDIMLRTTGGRVEPIFIESNYTPLFHGFGPQSVNEGLEHATRSWLRLLWNDLCTANCSPAGANNHAGAKADSAFTSSRIHLPERHQRRPAQVPKLERLPSAEDHLAFRGDAWLLNRPEGRSELHRLAADLLTGSKRVSVKISADTPLGVTLEFHRNGRESAFEVRFDDRADLARLSHPHAVFFPLVNDTHSFVDTERWTPSRFEYLDKDLIGPSLAGHHASSGLLEYLARPIARDGQPTPGARRFVEPGIGRSYLVDFLRFAQRPELTDFSVLGVGLTPYSRDGFALSGPYVDGLTSLKRAMHRHRNAERLEQAGCRVARSAAIIALDGLETTMPDETKEPAALIVRGFRSIFRVRQLDPLACLFDSLKHRPQILAFLMESRWASNKNDGALPVWAEERMKQAMARLGFGSRCLREVVLPGVHPLTENPFLREARLRRVRVIHRYAPILLRVAKSKLARELGRDPDADPLTDQDYVSWFAGQLGSQLARMKTLRFLHDYHHPGIARYSPQWNYTLCETNVTLLAEFPDLDTGVFVDRIDSETADALRISEQDATTLRERYDEFHARDAAQAIAVVRTLASIVFKGDAARTYDAGSTFEACYRQQLSEPSGRLAIRYWPRSGDVP